MEPRPAQGANSPREDPRQPDPRHPADVQPTPGQSQAPPPNPAPDPFAPPYSYGAPNPEGYGPLPSLPPAEQPQPTQPDYRQPYNPAQQPDPGRNPYPTTQNQPYRTPQRPVQPTLPSTPAPRGYSGGGSNGGTFRPSGSATGPRRRRRTNPIAIGVATLAVAAVLALLIWLAVSIFGDDGGGDDNPNLAAAEATATRAAELSAIAALTPESDPESTATAAGEDGEDGDDEPTEAPAEGDSNEGGGDDEDPAPTEPPAEEEDGAEEESTTLEGFLPTRRDVPDGFSMASENDFTEGDVAESLGTEDAADRLSEWGWSEGAVRTYAFDGEAAPADTNVLIVSVHHFGSSSDAGEALPYFADIVAEAQSLEELDVDTIADETRALSGQTSEGANQVVVYVRSGPYLIRIAGTSVEGDPTEAVISLASRLAG